MKKLSIILAIGLLLPLGSLSAEPLSEAPLESAILIKKLADWEKSEKDLLDAKIKEKRISVAKLLESHLDTATKAGNLKGANFVQAKIVELRPVKGEPVDKPVEVESAPITDPQGAVAGEWKLHKGGTSYTKLRFTDEGMELYKDGRDDPVFTQETRVQDNAMEYYVKPLKTWVPITLDKKGRELFVKIGDANVIYRK